MNRALSEVWSRVKTYGAESVTRTGQGLTAAARCFLSFGMLLCIAAAAGLNFLDQHLEPRTKEVRTNG